MAWDTRNGRSYFYRPVWRNGKPRRVYCGTGAAAEAEAQKDADRRREKQTRRARLLADAARVAAAELLLYQLTEWTGTLATATLLLAGHHQHHGSWRRSVFRP